MFTGNDLHAYRQGGRDLPLYRDWSIPTYDGLRGSRFNGPAILTWPVTLWGPLFQPDDLPEKTSAEPVASMRFAPDWEPVPLFRRPWDWEPSAVSPEPVEHGALPWMGSLGYRWQTESKTLTWDADRFRPPPHAAADLPVELLRLVAQHQWSQLGSGGYWGAECCFAYLACFFALNAASLQPSRELVAELQDPLDPDALGAIALKALETVTGLLHQSLGPAATYTFTQTYQTLPAGKLVIGQSRPRSKAAAELLEALY